MHSTELGTMSGTVPAFLTKLWRLVEDPECDELICWSANGLSFFIHDQTKFAKELLPMYFKHNNMASFVRQLNMYGFRKMMHIDQGGLKSEKDTMEFYHQFFLKGQENLLEFIKRKVPVSATAASRSNEEACVKADVMSEILTDVKAIRGKQESVDSLLTNMKRENEALWREVAFLRQKHLKQQQVVEKLIQFLVTLVQPGNRNINVVQRKLPLMLYDSSANNSSVNIDPKITRLSRSYSSTPSGSTSSKDGPVIKEVTDSIDNKITKDSRDVREDTSDQNLLAPGSNMDQRSPLSDLPLVNSPSVDSPLGTEDIMEPLSVLVPLQTPTSTVLMSPTENEVMEDDFLNSPVSLNLSDPEKLDKDLPKREVNEAATPVGSVPLVNESTINVVDSKPSTSNNSEMTVALSDHPSLSFSLLSPGLKRFDFERSSFSDHLEGIDNELDWLAEQINANPLSIDSSSLLGLFGADDTVPGNNLPMDSFRFSKGDVTGNEVVQYLPNLIGADIIGTDFDKERNSFQQSDQNDDSYLLQNDPIAEFLGTTEQELLKNLAGSKTESALSQLESSIKQTTQDPKTTKKSVDKSLKKKGTSSNSVATKRTRTS